MPTISANRFARAVILFIVLCSASIAAFAQAEPGILVFSPATYTVSEGAGSMQLRVARQLGAAGAISVSYATANGTAIAGTDFTAAGGILAWADGETADKTLDIPILQNAVIDGTRLFTLVLSNPTGGASVGVKNGTTTAALIRVTDDESDVFPAGNMLPSGFSSYLNGSESSGVWDVEPNDGYLSPQSLRSAATLGQIQNVCTYDEETGDYTCSDMPVTRTSSLYYNAAFFDGNISFAYRVSSDPVTSRFMFFLNGNPVLITPSQPGWNTFSTPVSNGIYALRWDFSNISLSPCSATIPPSAEGLPCADRAYIDTVSLPQAGMPLTVHLVGLSSTTGTVSGPGIACGVDCANVYPQDTLVTLVATAGPNSFFEGWFDGLCTGTGDCVVTMSNARSVSARFTPVSRDLSVVVNGGGSGSVTTFAGGIDCPGDCVGSYFHGLSINLIATPSPGSVFAGWSGAGCTGTDGCAVLVDANKTVTATFETSALTYPLSLSMAGAGSGTVTSSPAGIACSADCSTSFPTNSVVSLTAVANPGSTFTLWSGAGCYASTVCQVTVNTAKAVTANFLLLPAPAMIAAVPGNGQATIMFNPPDFNNYPYVSSYTADCNGVQVTGANSPIVVGPLTNGTTYSCRVTAKTISGASMPSAALPVTPDFPPLLTGVWSRKIHAGAGAQEIEISTNPPAGTIRSVEPRAIGAGHQIVFRFDKTITYVWSSAATAGTVTHTLNGNEVIVTLNGIADNTLLTVTLADVNGSLTVPAPLAFLVGDVTGNGTVSAGDISGIKARVGQAANGTNFRFDLNADGVIDQRDVSVAKARAGRALP